MLITTDLFLYNKGEDQLSGQTELMDFLFQSLILLWAMHGNIGLVLHKDNPAKPKSRAS